MCKVYLFQINFIEISDKLSCQYYNYTKDSRQLYFITYYIKSRLKNIFSYDIINMYKKTAW